MRRLIAFGLIAAAAGPAQAATLFDNGPAVTDVPARSIIRTGGAMFGVPAMSGPGLTYSVADNFTVGGGTWIVTDLSFFAYQFNAGGAFKFTNVSWSVVSGDVNLGTVVASGTTAVSNGGLLGYRVSPSKLQATERAIFKLDADVPDFTLAPGSYWLRWRFGFPGPEVRDYYQPPVASGATGNANVAWGGTNPYVWAIDAGDHLGNDLPFVINGTVDLVFGSGFEPQ